MLKSILKEYGVPWVYNRTLYAIKLKMMRTIPKIEKVFEKKVSIKRLNIFETDFKKIEEYVNELSIEKQKEIILVANKAIEGKIMGFSSIELDYGNPIDWTYNPITQKNVSNTLKWYDIPDFDPDRGDIKVIWEASRFTHLYYFVRAYMLTKDKKYYNAFSDQINNWLKINKYSYGPNYKCGQEATLRMINVLITYSAFKYYGLITTIDEENVQRIVEGSYKKVLSNFFYAYKCIRNNHTLSEITGMIIGAWCSYDNKKLDYAYRLLNKEISKQFKTDGGYIQHSFNYQRVALQLIEFVLKISEKTQRNLSNDNKERILNSANLLYQVQDETGDIPNYGANDGALIFPVTSCDYRDFRPIINTIYSLIDKKRLYDHGDYDEELLWFGINNTVDLPEIEKSRKSSSFHESGVYTLRHHNGFLMTILQNFDSRPLQMDQLHIDLWHKGVNILCDNGTYSYASEIGNKLSLTSAHNTVVVDGKEQMDKRGPFFIYNWTKRKSVRHSKELFEGTLISKNGYKHTRKIIKKKRGYLVSDSVIVNGNATNCKFYFHTPCSVNIHQNGFNLMNENKLICSVSTNGTIDVKTSYRSLYYLKKEKINCVVIEVTSRKNKFDIEFDIVLY